MAELKEYVDGLPNICGSDALVERAIAAGRDQPVFLGESPIAFDRIRSAAAVALHMHQPLVPAGGEDQYSGRVDRLVLGCTMPNFNYLPPASKDIETMAESQQLSIEEGVEKMMSLFLTPEFKSSHPDQTAQLKEVMLLETMERGMVAFLNQL